MTDSATPTDRSAERAGVSDADATLIVRQLGQILSSTHLYGLDHRVSMQALEEGYESLLKLLETAEAVPLTVNDEALMIEGRPVELRTPIMVGVRDRLRAVGAANLTLRRGITADEFIRLVMLLSERDRPDGDAIAFSHLLADNEMSHVESRQTVLREVAEDEVLVNREQMERDAARRGIEGPVVDEILALLRGEPAAAAGNGPLSATTVAAEPGKVAELILNVTRAQLEAGGTGAPTAEALSDAIAGCLRRVYESMAGDRRAQSQKGRRLVARTLAALEEVVLEKAGELTPEGQDAAVEETVKSAVEAMQDELQVEDLVGQYSRRREALAESERRMLRFMRGRQKSGEPVGDIEKRMLEAGLGSQDWRGILIKSGSGGLASGIEDAAALVGQLKSDMGRLMTALHDTSGTAQSNAAVTEATGRLGSEVQTLLDGTERRIDELSAVRRAAEEADAADPASSTQLSRKAIIEFMAEIVQELRQPISVCSCALDMLAMGRLADRPAVGQQLISTALDGVRRVDQLVDKILQVSGLPDSLSPDKQRLSLP